MRFHSLKTRILVLTTIPLSVLLVLFLTLTLRTADRAVRDNVQRSLVDAGSVFVKLLETRRGELMTMASVTARDPRFFATFAIPEDERGEEFGPTVEGVAHDFLRITGADFIEIFDGQGRFVSYVDRQSGAARTKPLLGAGSLREALRGSPAADFYRSEDHLVVAAAVPVFVSDNIEAIVRMGSYFDRDFVEEVKRLTGAEVRLSHNRREVASTYPGRNGVAAEFEGEVEGVPPLSALTPGSHAASVAFTAMRGGTDYLTVRVRMRGVNASDGFDADLGRDLGIELAPMVHLSQHMLLAGIAAILLTFLAAYLVAQRITRPISDIVAAASELQKGNYDHPLQPDGADEVAFLGRSFAAMRRSLQAHVEHLESLDQMKSNFIALAGHELKTPLTVISGFNEMIVSGGMGEVPESIRETTQLIQGRLQDLNRLVENILDMSRFEQGLYEFQVEDADLAQIARDAVGKRRVQALERNLALRAGLPVEAWPARVDRCRIEQAILHLLDNAIRFTPDGGTIHVDLQEAGDQMLLAVRDTGIGIPANELPWIFDKAYEVGDVMHHSSGRHQFGSRGFGMGLALCKAIVEGHGGEVRVKSVLGRGSEFTLVFPALASSRAVEMAT